MNTVSIDSDPLSPYEYAPFGALTVSRGASAVPNPWRFSSEYSEDDTATVYYNYRHYEPVMGRWMQRDPIEENGRGLYACCDNSMMLSSDLLGLEKKTFKYDTDPNSSRADAVLNPSFKQESSLKKIYDEIDVATTPYCPDGEKGGDPTCCHCIRKVVLAGHGGPGSVELGGEVFTAAQVGFFNKYKYWAPSVLKNPIDKAFADLFVLIRSRMCKGGTVEFITCATGQDPADAAIFSEFFGYDKSMDITTITYPDKVRLCYGGAFKGWF